MPILVCGINHKTAPIALRERVIFAADKLPIYLNDLRSCENIREVVFLSTCNRSEIYCEADNISPILDWFCEQHLDLKAELQSALYFYQDQEAVQHIMEVACGLDSMVLGESQILRQMKDAFSESVAASAVGTTFNRLFQHVFAVAKEVRNNTAIGACPVSVATAAVTFIKTIFKDPLEKATVLLIGAGATIDLVLRHLKNNFPKEIIIANRSQENALGLAKQYGARVIDFKKISLVLPEVDIVISATGSATPIIVPHMLSMRVNPLWMIDIAVPRDIDPDVGYLANVHLYSIDDLKMIIQRNQHGREHAALKAMDMIKQKSQEFMTWLDSLDMVATTIRAYRQQIDAICQLELNKAIKQIERGDNPSQVLMSFAHAFTNKLLHTPTVQLRQAGSEGRLEILQLAQQLFDISGSKLKTI